MALRQSSNTTPRSELQKAGIVHGENLGYDRITWDWYPVFRKLFPEIVQEGRLRIWPINAGQGTIVEAIEFQEEIISCDDFFEEWGAESILDHSKVVAKVCLIAGGKAVRAEHLVGNKWVDSMPLIPEDRKVKLE